MTIEKRSILLTIVTFVILRSPEFLPDSVRTDFWWKVCSFIGMGILGAFAAFGMFMFFCLISDDDE